MKLINTILLSTLLSHAGTEALSPSTISPSCPCDHTEHSHYTPIGVMASHTHEQGEWMFSYRYMFMNMQDNFMGTNEVSPTDIFMQGFMVAPIDMQMDMHMFGSMYALTDRLTLVGMLNLVELEMLHQRSPMMVMMGGPSTFSTSSSGIGDASIGALYSLANTKQQNVVAGLSLVLPTANTNEKDSIPNMMGMGVHQTLPYPMQLGSGSWGIKPSLTYTAHAGSLTLGAQVSGQIQLDDNSQGYKVGNRLSATTWLSHPVCKNLNASLRTAYTAWSSISGTHEELAPLPVQTTNTNLSGGQKLDAFFGLGYDIPQLHTRLNAEVGQTLWQDLNGPQLGSDWSLMLGLQSTF